MGTSGKEKNSPVLEAVCLYSRGFLLLKAGQVREGSRLLEDSKMTRKRCSLIREGQIGCIARPQPWRNWAHKPLDQL
jgi:hypothetical protein